MLVPGLSNEHLQPIRVSWGRRVFGETWLGHYAVTPAQMTRLSLPEPFLCILLLMSGIQTGQIQGLMGD